MPPPPTHHTLSAEESKLAELLPRGRLSIKCIEGINIHQTGDVQHYYKSDVSVRFRLGAAEKHQWKSTKIFPKQTVNPKFDDEIIHFDVTGSNRLQF